MLKEQFTKKLKFGHYRLTSIPVEKRVKSLKLCGETGIAAFS